MPTEATQTRTGRQTDPDAEAGLHGHGDGNVQEGVLLFPIGVDSRRGGGERRERGRGSGIGRKGGKVAVDPQVLRPPVLSDPPEAPPPRPDRAMLCRPIDRLIDLDRPTDGRTVGGTNVWFLSFTCSCLTRSVGEDDTDDGEVGEHSRVGDVGHACEFACSPSLSLVLSLFFLVGSLSFPSLLARFVVPTRGATKILESQDKPKK